MYNMYIYSIIYKMDLIYYNEDSNTAYYIVLYCKFMWVKSN